MRKGSKDDSSAEKLLRWGHLTLTVSQMFEARSVVHKVLPNPLERLDRKRLCKEICEILRCVNV